MSLPFKLLSGVIVDFIWGIGLLKGFGISLHGLWWSFLAPIVLSLIPAGEFINIGLISLGILFIYNDGLNASLQEYLDSHLLFPNAFAATRNT